MANPPDGAWIRVEESLRLVTNPPLKAVYDSFRFVSTWRAFLDGIEIVTEPFAMADAQRRAHRQENAVEQNRQQNYTIEPWVPEHDDLQHNQ
jgi:hypothetical protein